MMIMTSITTTQRGFLIFLVVTIIMTMTTQVEETKDL